MVMTRIWSMQVKKKKKKKNEGERYLMNLVHQCAIRRGLNLYLALKASKFHAVSPVNILCTL